MHGCYIAKPALLFRCEGLDLLFPVSLDPSSHPAHPDTMGHWERCLLDQKWLQLTCTLVKPHISQMGKLRTGPEVLLPPTGLCAWPHPHHTALELGERSHSSPPTPPRLQSLSA